MNDLGSDARALLESARGGDRATVADRERVRGRLLAQIGVGIALGATTAATTASAATTATAATGVPHGASSAALAIVTKVVVATAIVVGMGAGGVGVYDWGRARFAAARPARSESLATFNVPSPPPASLGVEPLGVPLAAQAPSSPPSPELRAPSTLEAETALLRDAGVALRQNRPERALALLDEHGARFPDGILAEERAGERVFALCALGRTLEARQDAFAFLRDRRRSPLAERVRTSCAAKR